MTTGNCPTPATARVAAGALFVDTAGRVLLVKPTYKPGWDIPGGYLNPGETPLAACQRELAEELGRTWPLHPQPLVIDWAPAPNEGDKILFVFDGGILTDAALDNVTFPDGEISQARLIPPHQFDTYLPNRLARRLHLALQARQQHRTIYAEHGTEAGTIPTTTPTPAP